MNFTTLFTLAVIVCLIGVGIRVSTWFSQGIHPSTQPHSTPARLTAALQGVVASVFSSRLLLIIKSFFVDLLFQKRIFDKNKLRWVAHTLIFFGFMLLLLMHAMGSLISANIFSDYQPTLNPFLFLRNFFGLMVLAGVCIAIYRRITLKNQRLVTYASDWTALIFLIVIIGSGVLLEGAKISSYSTYQRMVDEYGAARDDNEAKALVAFWVQENGLVSPNFSGPIDAELVTLGKEVNSMSCIECHAAKSNAFLSYSLAGVTRPFAAVLGDSGAVSMFWYLHILACLGFLAWLPFSKMFHVLSAPISLMIKGSTNDVIKEPANALSRQMVGLSACTHCGTCSLECSSNMFFESFDNEFILPSEKVQYLKNIASGKEKDPKVLKKMQQGLYVCTSCDRCTTVCPSGINLKEIFVSARYALLEQGVPERTLLSHFSFPLALAQNFVDSHLSALKKVTEQFKKSFQHLADITGPIHLGGAASDAVNISYRGCYSCQRCTNVCPVVRSYDNPVENLGMLPHQIIYTLGLGNRELAMGAQMIWSCSTCYLCQEHCPNQVELTDIFYSLKNSALSKIEAGANA